METHNSHKENVFEHLKLLPGVKAWFIIVLGLLFFQVYFIKIANQAFAKHLIIKKNIKSTKYHNHCHFFLHLIIKTNLLRDSYSLFSVAFGSPCKHHPTWSLRLDTSKPLFHHICKTTSRLEQTFKGHQFLNSLH